MNRPDEHDGSDPESVAALTPSEEAEYAALLAAHLPPATPEETLPAPVAARLDESLAALTAERRAGATSRGPSAGAGAQLRRRRIGSALLVAAAVTVGGAVVLPTWMDGQGGDAESADSAATADLDAGAGAGASEDRVEAAPLPASPPRVRRDHLEEDVTRLVREGDVTAVSGQTSSRTSPEDDELDSGEAGADKGAADEGVELRDSACVLPPLDDGATWQVVRYAGDLAVLVADPEDAPPPRSATLLPCAGGPALAEVELPVD